MTSTEMNLGLTEETRPSSRVLKPPGGGHTNIFGEQEVAVNAPRPKYNQQNSSNLNACLGSTDPNQKVEKLREEISSHGRQPEANSQYEQKAAGQTSAAIAASNSATANNTSIENTNTNNSGRTGRVPPGGHSSGGFW